MAGPLSQVFVDLHFSAVDFLCFVAAPGYNRVQPLDAMASLSLNTELAEIITASSRKRNQRVEY
jgi:hypothetical protein